MSPRKERRRIAKERGEDWKTSTLNERPATEMRLMQSAKEELERAKKRLSDDQANQAIVAMVLADLLRERKSNL